MDIFGDLPAAIFSPAKMVYISFVILTGLKILPTIPARVFLGICALYGL
jgi:hypothetical protein